MSKLWYSPRFPVHPAEVQVAISRMEIRVYISL